MNKLIAAFLLCLGGPLLAQTNPTAVTVQNGTVINTGPVNFNLTTTPLELNGIPINAALVTPLGIVPNAAGGFPVLNAIGNVPQSNLLGPVQMVYTPTTTSGTVTTITTLNVSEMSDSIGAGTGANVPYSAYYMGPVTVNPNGWFATELTLGFAKSAIGFPYAMGGQTLGDAASQAQNSIGQTCAANVTSGASTGTLTGPPSFIVSGAIVTGTFVTGTQTLTNTQVFATTTIPGASTTITVNSAAGIVSGMFIQQLSLSNNNGSTSDPFPPSYTGTVTNVTGTTVTISVATPAGGTITGSTVVFSSPIVTISGTWSGTGTTTLTVGGTLLTGSLITTANSTTATLVSGVTGLVPSAQWYFGMGSMGTPPGEYLKNISGSTLTLGIAATSSGTFTFAASSPLHAPKSAITTAINGNYGTPYLNSPLITGVGVGNSYMQIMLGMNDSFYGTSLANFQSTYASLLTNLTTWGYTPVPMTIPPPANNNSIGEVPSRVAGYNGYIVTLPNVIDDASLFPAGNPNVPGDFWHITDGVHPSNFAHQTVARYTDKQMFALFANSAFVSFQDPVTTPNAAWLPPSVAQTNISDTFTLPQTIFNALSVWGISNQSASATIYAGNGPGGASSPSLAIGYAANGSGTGSITNSLFLAGSGSGGSITCPGTESIVLNSDNSWSIGSNANATLLFAGSGAHSYLDYTGLGFYAASTSGVTCGLDNGDSFRGFVQIGSFGGPSGSRSYRWVNDNGTGLELRAYNDALSSFLQLASFTGNSTSTGSLVLAGGLSVTGTTTLATSLTGLAKLTSGVVGTATAGTDYASALTVQTGTLVSGSSTKTVPAGSHPWVQDNAASLTNVGSLVVTVSGTTATITSTNVLDTSPYTLYNAGSQ